MTYEADRAGKAANSADFDTSTERVASDASYANEALAACTSAPPNGLSIKDSNALQARVTHALKTYTDFQVSTADTANWVLALVAMIPCIQVRRQYSVHKISIDSVAHFAVLLPNRG